MLESSFGLTFFLKKPEKNSKMRFIYIRVTVDGLPKEKSTKRKWDPSRWDQSIERAIGNKEDARIINNYLDDLVSKVNKVKNDAFYNERSLTALYVLDTALGKTIPRNKVLEEFQLHNNEIEALQGPEGYSKGTVERYITARSHVQEFIMFKYHRDDIEFRELNYEFVKDYDFYLRTVRKCNNNTTLKYISNFKKIVLRAIDKEIITTDPFKNFKGKKNKTNKKPLSSSDLAILEAKTFSTARLTIVRDIFVFQCYTGLAYADVLKLKKSEIKIGVDGENWIMTERQKTGSSTNVPLLPKAIDIMNKYADHPLSAKKGTVLPVASNQKMNEYLKEIANLCGFTETLNTHKARRTFGSTVTLNNDVPIHVVKEMLGHQSVKQTEEYAITEQQTIGRQMNVLKNKLLQEKKESTSIDISVLEQMELQIKQMKMLLLSQQKMVS